MTKKAKAFIAILSLLLSIDLAHSNVIYIGQMAKKNAYYYGTQIHRFKDIDKAYACLKENKNVVLNGLFCKKYFLISNLKYPTDRDILKRFFDGFKDTYEFYKAFNAASNRPLKRRDAHSAFRGIDIDFSKHLLLIITLR